MPGSMLPFTKPDTSSSMALCTQQGSASGCQLQAQLRRYTDDLVIW